MSRNGSLGGEKAVVVVGVRAVGNAARACSVGVWCGVVWCAEEERLDRRFTNKALKLTSKKQTPNPKRNCW